MADITVRKLRTHQTDPEKRLWGALRDRRLNGLKFRRQRRIGRYVVDFACIEHRLIVEADGGQHLTSGSDPMRTAWLESQGWTVIRFWNNEIMENLDGVLVTILGAVRRDPLTLPSQSDGPLPLPQGGRGVWR